MSIFPVFQDIKDFFNDILFVLGINKNAPDFDRYSYRDKFQYWGTAIGVVIMSISGFILWFKDFSMAIFPKWFIDVTIIIHGSSGLIIFLLLFIWHIYDVHFSQHNFPMSRIWIDGKISISQLKKTHFKEYLKLINEKESK